MRYAIYFIPDPSSSLWAFGSSVLGYDSAAVADVPQPSHPLFRKPFVRTMVEGPRTYGFHGTLKAPFELKDGATLDQLMGAAAAFGVDETALSIGCLDVVEIGSFLALVPAQEPPDLKRLASRVVEHFEPFRAPLNEAGLAKRLKTPLTPEQTANLHAWGYPYVFDEFRFHMTLTGPLDEHVRRETRAGLLEIYRPIAQPVIIDAIAVCEQAEPGERFRTLRRFRLKT
ncbi:MAG: DUF1045 domain-containing protein [Pseudomonadota bacterium]